VKDALVLGGARVTIPAPAPVPVLAKPSIPPTPSVPAPTPPSSKAPLVSGGKTGDVKELLDGKPVTFTTGKTQGKEALSSGNLTLSKKEADSMVGNIRQSAQGEPPMTLIRFEGHADPRGSATANQKISEDRAKEIMGTFEKEMENRGFTCSGKSSVRTCTDSKGGPAITLQAVGFGETFASAAAVGCSRSVSESKSCDKAFESDRRVDIKLAVPVNPTPGPSATQPATKPTPPPSPTPTPTSPPPTPTPSSTPTLPPQTPTADPSPPSTPTRTSVPPVILIPDALEPETVLDPCVTFPFLCEVLNVPERAEPTPSTPPPSTPTPKPMVPRPS
jgi:outer membrane protein OmpA-like peptidoglycan-associated protein